MAAFALVLAFLGIYLTRIEYTQLSRLRPDWVLLLLATCVAITFRYWGVYTWQVILKELGSISLPHFSVLSSVYSKAWMGRYIPGKVTWLAGKVYLASTLGISKSRLAVSAFIEAAMQVVALLTVSMLLLGLDPRLDAISDVPKFIMLALAGLCLLVLTPWIFNPLVRKIYSGIVKREPGAELRTNGNAALKSFFLYAIGALLSGTSFFFLVRAVDPTVSLNLYIYCIGAYNLAGAIGMATPIVPSGIGVRDGVLLALLTIVLPPDISIALTVLSRLWSVIVDVLFYSLAAVILQNRRIPSR